MQVNIHDPTPIWHLEKGDGPLVATAIHDGHNLRADLLPHLALSESDRLREEDPFTGRWTAVAGTRVVATRSRFEVDLNRPREKAVYCKPEDCWGLQLWKGELPVEQYERSLAEYDQFHDAMRALLASISRAHGQVIVYDLHTYNHMRDGPIGAPADPQGNPQVNIGTGSVDRQRWGGVVDAFVDALGAYDFPGGKLDVRENVKFQGGEWSRRVHRDFPDTGLAIAVEFKKFFMDEWTGEPNEALVAAIGDALQSTVEPVLAAAAKSLRDATHDAKTQ